MFKEFISTWNNPKAFARNRTAACMAVCLAATAAIVTLTQNAVARVDLSIGGTIWYNRWEPAWLDGRLRRYALTSLTGPRFYIHDNRDFRPQMMPLYGPTISVKFFNKISIAGVFIYGATSFKTDGPALLFSTATGISAAVQRFNRSVVKIDSDVTVSCRILDVLSLYTGYKYQSYSYDESYYSLNGAGSLAKFLPNRKFNICHGAGLGLASTVRLVDTLYLHIGLSAIVLWGFDRISDNYFVGFSPPVHIGYQTSEKGNYLAYGGTGNIGFAYQTPVNVGLSLGFRCQVLRYRQLSAHIAYESLNNRYDLFYGLTFSAVYTISFSRGKNS